MYSLDRLVRHFHRKPDGLAALTWGHLFRQVAIGMVGMFGVVFVYQLGGDMVRGLGLVVIFFGLQRLVVLGSIPLVGSLIERLGYRWLMLVSMLALMLKLVFLTQVSLDSMVWLLPALFFGGMGIAAYWLSYHSMFIDDNDDEQIGRQIGILTLIERGALVVSPLLAGLLIERFGFAVMFAVAAVLIVGAVVPVFLMPHHEHKTSDFSLKGMLEFVGEEKTFSRSLFWWRFQDGIQTFFWPVFLVIVVKSYSTFGAIVSVAMIANSVAVYWAGKMYDKRPLRRGFPVMAGLVSLTWVMRFLSRTAVAAGTTDGLNRLFSPLWWMKIRRNTLLVGERRGGLMFAAARESLVTLAFILSLMVGYLMLGVWGLDWIWLAALAILGVGLSSWLVRDR